MHMMGRKENTQGRLFCYSVNLSKMARRDHPLRKITELIDFDFIYNEVEDMYG